MTIIRAPRQRIQSSKKVNIESSLSGHTLNVSLHLTNQFSILVPQNTPIHELHVRSQTSMDIFWGSKVVENSVGHDHVGHRCRRYFCIAPIEVPARLYAQRRNLSRIRTSMWYLVKAADRIEPNTRKKVPMHPSFLVSPIFSILRLPSSDTGHNFCQLSRSTNPTDPFPSLSLAYTHRARGQSLNLFF